MIIRATFNDNDFIEILENFFNLFVVNIHSRSIEYRNKSLNTISDCYGDKASKFCKMSDEETSVLQLTQKSKLNDEEKKNCEKLLTDSILAFIRISSLTKENYEYLEKELSVKLVDSIKDTFENGEVCYYISQADTCITL